MEQIQLAYHLERFADQVSEGNYKKMNYLTWKDLQRYGNAVNIKFDLTTGVFIITSEECSYYFKYNDNSFGAYLWEMTEYCDYEVTKFALQTKSDTNDKTNITDKKENNTMNFNFEFGPVKSDSIKMSIYGLAVKNASGTYVSYNDGSLIDVDILNFDGSKFLYKMPVALKEIKVADVVIHSRKPMIVTEVLAKSLKVVDPIDGEAKEVLLTKSPFGFDFATKVVNILGSTMTAGADASNPFGNMWMLFALAGDNKGKTSDMLLPLMMMNQSGVATNPMMMYALLAGGNGGNDMLLAMAMMGAAGQTNPFGLTAAPAQATSN